MQVQSSVKTQPQLQASQVQQAVARAAAKDVPSARTQDKSQPTSASEQSTYVNWDGKSKESSSKISVDTNKPARQRNRSSAVSKRESSSGKANEVSLGELQVIGHPSSKPHKVELLPPLNDVSFTELARIAKTAAVLALSGEISRVESNKSHPGAPPGYAGVSKKETPPDDMQDIPPEVKEKAEKRNKETTAADKGEKHVVIDKKGRVYVVCVEGDPKRTVVYEKKPPNPP